VREEELDYPGDDGLAETDRDYGALQMLRQHLLQGLRELGRGEPDAV
jgi:hypothetical protein